nr:PREDICTED: uncharacterized protein LOC104147159 [Struthio camelus australis]
MATGVAAWWESLAPQPSPLRQEQSYQYIPLCPDGEDKADIQCSFYTAKSASEKFSYIPKYCIREVNELAESRKAVLGLSHASHILPCLSSSSFNTGTRRSSTFDSQQSQAGYQEKFHVGRARSLWSHLSPAGVKRPCAYTEGGSPVQAAGHRTRMSTEKKQRRVFLFALEHCCPPTKITRCSLGKQKVMSPFLSLETDQLQFSLRVPTLSWQKSQLKYSVKLVTWDDS